MFNKFLFAFLFLPFVASSQSQARDSLLVYLEKNQTAVHEIIDGYNKVSIAWGTVTATLAGVVALLLLTWQLWGKEKLVNYIRLKAQEAVDAANNLKTANILVLSSLEGQNQGNTTFLSSFFKAKNFPNVHYEFIGNEFKTVSNFQYDVVFANNDDGFLDKTIVRKYIREDTVLFYFGKSGSWDFNNDTPDISRKINFANSRAQIYGNLMSSLEFLGLINPKLKNT